MSTARARKPRAEPAAAAKSSAPAAETVVPALVSSSIESHMRTKGMWGGALERSANPDLLGAKWKPTGAETDEAADESSDAASDAASVATEVATEASSVADGIELVYVTNDQTPVVLTAIKEILSNATDQVKIREPGPKGSRVTAIDIDFDPASGTITIRNNGPGVPTVQLAAESAAAGRPVYSTEIAFGRPPRRDQYRKGPRLRQRRDQRDWREADERPQRGVHGRDRRPDEPLPLPPDLARPPRDGGRARS